MAPKKPTKKPILLRGHHCLALGLAEAGHKGVVRAISQKQRGKTYTDAVMGLLESLQNNKSAKVEITDSFGDLCKGCSDMHTCAQRNVPNFDVEIIRKYGLKKGEVYTVSELIKKIKKHPQELEKELKRIEKLLEN